MSAKSKSLQARFSKETRFKVSPTVAPRRGAVETRLETLKHQLLSPALENINDAQLESELRWAAQEAASLAWATPFPLLMMPALFDEKTAHARQRWENQQRIWRDGSLALAA